MFYSSLFVFQVKEEMLLEALTTRKTVTVGERLIVPYKLAEVILSVNAAAPPSWRRTTFLVSPPRTEKSLNAATFHYKL